MRRVFLWLKINFKNMRYENYQYVIEANKAGISDVVKKALNNLQRAQKSYPNLIMDVIRSGNLSRQIDLSFKESQGNSRIDPDFPLANTAGAYFFNEEIIGGSREKEVIDYVNRIGSKNPDWKTQKIKLKLGPGIGLIEAPTVYKKLIEIGINNPSLTVNYTAPFGTAEAREGIRSIMDSRIDPEGNFFSDSGVFVTEGATEGIDLFMDAISTLSPQSRAIFLGLSYYTGPYSAMQKRLKIERLITNPININGDTRFFPSADEIKNSLPSDTKSLIITVPNNPNGETYCDQDLTKIIELAKNRKFYVLFDAIFENMYFDETENYRSRLLQIASELGALDRIVVVDSLSKTKNFPGKRLGFLATTDKEMSETLTNIVLSRRCNPPLTVGPLLSFEGLARKTKTLIKKSPNMSFDKVIDFVFGQENFSFSKQSFKKMFLDWNLWDDEVLKYYKNNLVIVKALLDRSASGWSPDQAAFNTFVRSVKPGNNINSMDFLAKFMYAFATYTQVGPCFGISQKLWDTKLGIWPRISYASSREDLIEALTRLVVFTQFYQEKNFGDPNKFPVLQINFDNQI